MRNANPTRKTRPMIEALEGRTLASISPSLAGARTFATHMELTVDAGTLGQPITFNVTVFASGYPEGRVDLYYRGRIFRGLAIGLMGAVSPDPKFEASQATYTIPAGPAGAKMFGVGLHVVRAQFEKNVASFFSATFLPSSAVVKFRVNRPDLPPPPQITTMTLSAGSGPALQAGQTASVQYTAYSAATYRAFYSTETKTPDTFSFTVDANPEQVPLGFDQGVLGMQAGETRAIYVPYPLAHGKPGSRPSGPPRANLVYLVTLVSIA
jgi:hypothetical protein